LSRSWTTRPRRAGEPDDAYTFVDEKTFRDRIDAGGFLEWAQVLGEYYGTPVPDAGDLDVVLEIDVQGAEKVLERCDNVVCVLLLAPSREVQEQRLRGRGDDEEHVRLRLELGEREVEMGRRFAHDVVVNDDVDRATDELAAIVEQSRQRFSA
jgi:guanylate kinase